MAVATSASVTVVILLAVISPIFSYYYQYDRYWYQETPDEEFARCDTNNDSMLSFLEFLNRDESYGQQLKDAFEQYDTNNDGVIKKAEIEAYYQKLVDEEMEQQVTGLNSTISNYDVGDYKLQQPEFVKYLEGKYYKKCANDTILTQVFKKYDTNKDKALDASELCDLDEDMTYPNEIAGLETSYSWG
uniref:EF-hand domain-containing protein n=1 Tax=Plectus sambesii TaxID=2011161 RepID=A0A914VBM5_9BILA